MPADPVRQTTGLDLGELSFPPDRGWRDDGASFVAGHQGLTVSVSEEKAIDSYNSQFECSYILSRGEAEALYDWLGKALGR